MKSCLTRISVCFDRAYLQKRQKNKAYFWKKSKIRPKRDFSCWGKDEEFKSMVLFIVVARSRVSKFSCISRVFVCLVYVESTILKNRCKPPSLFIYDRREIILRNVDIYPLKFKGPFCISHDVYTYV